MVRADSGFCREAILAWGEAHGVDCVIGLARNERLQAMLRPALDRARERACLCGGAARASAGSSCRTQKTWSRARRVTGRAGRLGDKDNPRFIVTGLARGGEELHAQVYCARGERENRINEQQQDLFADRLSSAGFAANQLRLWLSAFAYVLVERLRAVAVALKGTELAQATAGIIRLGLFKLAARVEVSVLRIRVRLADSSPVAGALRPCAAKIAPVAGLSGSALVPGLPQVSGRGAALPENAQNRLRARARRTLLTGNPFEHGPPPFSLIQPARPGSKKQKPTPLRPECEICGLIPGRDESGDDVNHGQELAN